MPGVPVESNIYALWMSAQHDAVTPATVGVKRLIQVGGDFDINRDDSGENYSDLDRYGNSTDWVATLVGTGTPVIQCTTNELAYLCWVFFGAETFTIRSAGSTPAKFVFIPGVTTGFYSTWWKRVGLSTIHRAKFNKCKIGSLKLEGSTATKALHATFGIDSLDPGEVFTSDPVPATMPTQTPFIYTEGQGQWTIDGATYTGQSQFSITVSDANAVVYGDDVVPMAIVPGNAQITIDGLTMILEDQELARFNTQIYGTASPTGGTKPIKTLPALGSYVATFTRGLLDARESIKIELPGVRWSPSLSIPPAPDGGVIEHALTGGMRKVPANPGIRITIETGLTGDNAAHVVP